MAVAVQSVSTAAWAGVDSGNTLTVNKPSGTVDGDLLIAHIAGADNTSGSNTISAPAGWTTLGNLSVGSTGSADLYVFYKTASSEGASYAFTNSSGANLMMAGAIYRIDGHGGTPSLQISIDGDDTADSTPTFTNTVTPTFANSLFLFLLSANDNAASGSVSSYSITNDNPTWTEQYDQYGSGDAYFGASDGDGLMSGASAVRSAITATGDSTCTLTTFANRSVGAIVVIPPPVSVTTTIDGAGSVVLNGNNVTINYDYVMSVDSPGTVTLSGGDITITDKDKTVFTGNNKSSTTWTNNQKS